MNGSRVPENRLNVPEGGVNWAMGKQTAATQFPRQQGHLTAFLTLQTQTGDTRRMELKVNHAP